MKLYKIAELEQLTGIKAHTIRIWEKRYNLIEPVRTSTNIRLYNDEQVKKLLNVATLLTGGMKISAISALSNKALDAEVINTAEETESVSATAFVNDMVSAMLTFNEIEFEQVFESARKKYGTYKCVTNVIYPLLNKIGLLWSVSKTAPVQEHFASNIIRRKLFSAINDLDSPKKKGKTFLLFLPPHEMHEIGLLLSHYMIRAAGYKCIYLGQDVPYEDINQLITTTKPTHLLTFFHSRKNIPEIAHELKKSLKPGQARILVSGNELVRQLAPNKNLSVLEKPADLEQFF